MYQDALDIYFTTQFHGKDVRHPHKVDFLLHGKLFIVCKAIAKLRIPRLTTCIVTIIISYYQIFPAFLVCLK